MKFLIIQENGRHEKNRHFRESQCLKRALEREGHACTVWGLGHENYSTSFEKISEDCDVVLSLENYDTGWHPSVSSFSGTKIFWSIDSHMTLDLHLKHCQKSVYDLLLNSSEQYLEKFHGLVKYAAWFPNAYPSDLIAPNALVSRNVPVGFCGSSIPRRNAILDAIEKKVKIKRDTFVIGSDMVDALSSYQIAFNYNIADDINYRTFEATAAGAMLLTNYTPNLEKLFDIGKDIIVYDSIEDAIEKIAFYASHADLRESIAGSGSIRSHSQHSYDVRANQLISIIDELERHANLG